MPSGTRVGEGGAYLYPNFAGSGKRPAAVWRAQRATHPARQRLFSAGQPDQRAAFLVLCRCRAARPAAYPRSGIAYEALPSWRGRRVLFHETNAHRRRGKLVAPTSCSRFGSIVSPPTGSATVRIHFACGPTKSPGRARSIESQQRPTRLARKRPRIRSTARRTARA